MAVGEGGGGDKEIMGSDHLSRAFKLCPDLRVHSSGRQVETQPGGISSSTRSINRSAR